MTMGEKDSNKVAVNVHSRLTVVSSTPTEPVGSTHALSPLDHTMGSHTVHVIFYYRNSPFLKTGWYIADLDNVRISLSDSLSKYPRMTGRLVLDGEGNWEVKYNDAGVRMFKAEVGFTVDEWLRFADESDERNLTVWEDMPDGDPTLWSPFRIQITEFVGGGLAIGLSCTHLLADPTSATLFFKTWTDINRNDPTGHNPPVLTLPQLKTLPSKNTFNTTKYLEKKSKLTQTPSVKMATSTFKFSNKTIKQCLSKIAAKCSDVTPFDYLAALFWSRIIELKTLITPMTTHSISLCVDSRKLLEVPLPIKFFGNALHFSQLSLQNEVLLGENGLAEAVESVHRHVTGIKKDDVLSVIDWLETSRKGLNGGYPKMAQMYGPELTCVSMEHLMVPKDGSKDEFEALVYEAKFWNGEKPAHVSYHLGHAEGEGLIVVAPSPEGGLGRIVTVTLPVEQIAKLCEDPIIMELDPTTILGGKR